MRTWPRTDGRTALRTIDRTNVGVPVDPYFSSTVLLLPGNGTNGAQNNTFLDGSTNNFTITRNGNTTQGTFSPFPLATGASYSAAVNGGSGYFDGSGDYLTAPDDAAWSFGAGNFTVECWAYPTASPNQPILISQWSGSSGSTTLSWALLLSNDANRNLRFLASSDGANVLFDLVSSSALALNAWNHIAIVRNGNTFQLYLNGAAATGGSTTDSSSLFNATNALSIGANSTGGVPFSGYISNARIVKGSAVYSGATYTVPTAPLTAITNTSLLLNFTNAGITDATAKNDLETVGNAQISTAQSKFGGSSIAFDGTGDYLTSNGSTSSLYAFGTGDFTIELWLRLGSVSGNQSLVDIRPSGTNGLYPLLYASATSLVYYVDSASRISGGTLSTGTWYHIAVARSGTSTKLFLDGTQIGSTYTDSNNYLAGSGAPWIGAFRDGTGALNGYINDLRITKGVARYTANFTPPTAAFPLR